MSAINWLWQILIGSGFMPHGCCYMWDPHLITMHVVSDAIIALAYFSIPLTLLYFVRHRHDLVFSWLFISFALFIVACGATHLMEIVSIWHPLYWLAGWIKIVTAILSIMTAISLVGVIPRALLLPSPQLLAASNERLAQEVAVRTKAARKVEMLNGQLREQAARLEAANQELEAFGYTISHDLRAPLRHVTGYVELLREEVPNLTPEASRFLRIITDAARQMARLIDFLLAYSRLGTAAMRPRAVDSGALVADLREKAIVDSANRQIEWEIKPLPTVWADPILLRQVWANLIDNALKYTQRRRVASIEIGHRARVTEDEFYIRDNGAGFDARYTDKLFGLFERLHSRDEFEGSGVGLANIRRIVTRHGGKTWAEGEVDRGATFYFTLPRSLPEEGNAR